MELTEQITFGHLIIAVLIGNFVWSMLCFLVRVVVAYRAIRRNYHIIEKLAKNADLEKRGLH